MIIHHTHTLNNNCDTYNQVTAATDLQSRAPLCRGEQELRSHPHPHPRGGGRSHARSGSAPAVAQPSPVPSASGRGWPQGSRSTCGFILEESGPGCSCGSLQLSPQPSDQCQPLQPSPQRAAQRGAHGGVWSGEAAGQQRGTVPPARRTSTKTLAQQDLFLSSPGLSTGWEVARWPSARVERCLLKDSEPRVLLQCICSSGSCFSSAQCLVSRRQFPSRAKQFQHAENEIIPN